MIVNSCIKQKMLYLKSPLTSLGYILSWTTTKALATTFKVDKKGHFKEFPKIQGLFKTMWTRLYNILKAKNCLKLLSTSVLCPQRAKIHQKQTFYHLGVSILVCWIIKPSWKYHIDAITAKICKTIGLISKLRHSIPRHILLYIYQTLIHSHLNYGFAVWGQASKASLKKF